MRFHFRVHGNAGFSDQSTTAREGETLLALAGNPNVGKSTLFNRLTGLHQHTGNWPGKTVDSACGRFSHAGRRYLLMDTPGAYSLAARSDEEVLTRDFLCFGAPEAVIVVCDATCAERSLILALQILEITGNVIICMNLCDEAEKKGIFPNTDRLSAKLGVPVVPMSAARGRGVDAFLHAVDNLTPGPPRPISLPAAVETACAPLVSLLESREIPLPPRWITLRLLEGDADTLAALQKQLGVSPEEDAALASALQLSREILHIHDLDAARLSDLCAASAAAEAEALCRECVRKSPSRAALRDRRIDRVLTHPVWGIPVMLALLALVLWLTISGANYPSALLSRGFSWLGTLLRDVFASLHAPPWLTGALLDGVYTTVAWVVAVMLPPMAIFFPLFTILEDLGYLPRMAFNLDGSFKRSSACGKQALTMCMGLGCNAAGVVGCRIIDSPREKLIAALTNSFMPCNGRFPTIISLIALFFTGSGLLGSALSALLLTLVILLGVVSTLLASKLLSKTLLRGVPSSFTLELPPYRKPQILRVLVRSILDRTLFVLGRAVTVAAPAGLLLWLIGNLRPGGVDLLQALAAILDAPGRFLGMDGVILLAFILGLPANELVLPIMLMCYLSQGQLTEPGALASLGTVLRANGWTGVTSACFILFSLLHWPCATTLLTIRKETGSWRYTALAAALPTAFGLIACLLVRFLSMLL
ncbi:MAG: ferrous iron transport protein B [Oscillospiraceae bacterium]|nr:ferrous iron transport protein B [Oscillospiraceae bacterium]MBR6561715.1 ferrous iron transport protein B [Oscillospiraceae bacterium]